MSRYRRDASGEFAEGALGCLFFALFAAIAAGIYAIVESSKVPPQEELQKLKHLSFWGQNPDLQICLNCGAGNEAGEIVCATCGPMQIVEENDDESLLKRQVIFLVKFLSGVVIFLLILYLLSVLGKL